MFVTEFLMYAFVFLAYSLFIIFPVSILILLLFPIVEIEGSSMLPTLQNGEIYIGSRVFHKDRCQIGDIYVFKAPYDPGTRYIVKRLTDINKDGDYFFVGDNPSDSYDSREYGYVSKDSVVARIKPTSLRIKL